MKKFIIEGLLLKGHFKIKRNFKNEGFQGFL